MTQISRRSAQLLQQLAFNGKSDAMEPRDENHCWWWWSSSLCYDYRYLPLEPEENTSCHRVAYRRLPRRSSIIAVGASVFALTAMMAICMLPRPTSLGTGGTKVLSFSDGFGDEADDSEFVVKVQDSHAGPNEMELYPWEHLAEPWKKTSMQIMSWPSSFKEEDTEFRWKVSGVQVGVGASTEYFFESLGSYECAIEAVRSSPTGVIEVKHNFTVTVKYVRREIRSLTDRDRETFFNAVSVLQRVPSAVGQQLYGRKYFSKDYFNRLHLYYGGQKDCDHWHDGAGFVTSHIAVSLMFEQALQAVNPSIALPYWDFTIEGTEYNWATFRHSSVFSDDWFGSGAPRNALRTPDRGRFAYVPIMTDAREYSDLYNAYGLLRSSWNTDPDPFLTRHDHIFGYPNNRKPAGCRQYRDAVLQTSWMRLSHSMNAGAHGHIHELLGGVWSADWHGFEEKTTERVYPFMHNIVPYMKFLWRSGYLMCPESCTMDVPWRDCQCTCANLEDLSKTPSQILAEAGLLDKTVGLFFYDRDMKIIENLGNEQDGAFLAIPGYSENETKDIYRELLSVLCTPMKIGTHYEGISTNDVTFWVLHPTFDRLWHLRRLETESSYDESWIGSHPCYGHNPNDTQPFFNLFDDETEVTDGGVQVPKKYRTNIELYDLLRPDKMAVPYVYDNFQWRHCNDLQIFLRGRSEDESH